MMDIHQILKLLPHRYPILLVDRVLEIEKGKRIKALKNVSINEPFFMGHFPKYPVMPGVLMLEAMAQTAALLAFHALDVMPDENTVYYFAGNDNARFEGTCQDRKGRRIAVRLNGTYTETSFSFRGGAQIVRGTPYIPASITARRISAQCPANAEYF